MPEKTDPHPVLFLSREDLRPLLVRPELIEQGFNSIAHSLVANKVGGASGWWAFPLSVHSAKLNVNALTMPDYGTVLRVWPDDREQAPKDGISMLFDRERGRLLAFMGAGEFLMWRTAGPVLLACRYLAPQSARTLAVIGTGIQAQYHLVGLQAVLPDLTNIRVYSRQATNREAYRSHVMKVTGLPVSASESVRACVEDADVILNTSGSFVPVFEDSWIRPGALVTDIFLGAPRPESWRIITPTLSTPETHPSGWEPHPEAQGYEISNPDATLADILSHNAPARTRQDETVLYVQLGVFPWDVALATFAYQWAIDNSIGRYFSI